MYCLGSVRHGGGVNLIQALMGNVGTCRLDDEKGKSPSGRPTRVKVPKRGTGTEQPVVAMKSVKAERAKGLRYSAKSTGQPDDGRNR